MNLRILAVLALLTCASCAATSQRYRFSPSPLEVLVQPDPDGAVLARAYVAVIGAERSGGRSDGHPELLVRVRLANESERPVSLDPATARVVGSDAAEFGAPSSEPPGRVEVAPGRSESVLLRFPFPREGSLRAPGLTGVHVRFDVDYGTGRAEVGATLERVVPEVVPYGYRDHYYYGYPYYHGPRWHFGASYWWTC